MITCKKGCMEDTTGKPMIKTINKKSEEAIVQIVAKTHYKTHGEYYIDSESEMRMVKLISFKARINIKNLALIKSSRCKIKISDCRVLG